MSWRSREATLLRVAGVLKPLASIAAIGLLIWLLIDAGPARLTSHLYKLGPVVPLLLGLTGLRHALQAAGWRLAIPAEERPSWGAAARGVVAGEAVGYLAWAGPITREPVKTWFVHPRASVSVALAAAVAERAAYAAAAAALAIAAAAVVAARSGHIAWFIVPVVVVTASATSWKAFRPRPVPTAPLTGGAGRLGASKRPGWVGSLREMAIVVLAALNELRQFRRGALVTVVVLAVTQQAILVFEAYLILAWLGAGPQLAS